jgi:hypothetical protein
MTSSTAWRFVTTAGEAAAHSASLNVAIASPAGCAFANRRQSPPFAREIPSSVSARTTPHALPRSRSSRRGRREASSPLRGTTIRSARARAATTAATSKAPWRRLRSSHPDRRRGEARAEDLKLVRGGAHAGDDRIDFRAERSACLAGDGAKRLHRLGERSKRVGIAERRQDADQHEPDPVAPDDVRLQLDPAPQRGAVSKIPLGQHEERRRAHELHVPRIGDDAEGRRHLRILIEAAHERPSLGFR